MLCSSSYRCAESALADYLELVLGAFQDTMSNIRINRYGDEHLGYWAAVPETQAVAGKPPERRQTGGSGFAMAEKYISFTHPLSFLTSHSSFSHCSVWALHKFCPHSFEESDSLTSSLLLCYFRLYIFLGSMRGPTGRV